MTEFFKKHRTMCLVALGLMAIVVLFFYLRALYQPGVWYRDFFMARQEDGSFVGRDEWYNVYRILVEKTDLEESKVSFSVNDETRVYRVRNADPVEIFENDTLLFSGEAHPMGDSWLLMDEEGDTEVPFTVVVGGIMPEQNELFPGPSTVYHWAVREDCGTRGEPSVLIVLVLLLAFLFADLRWPDLFWNLRYSLAVDGGEPSEFYRVGQVLGRVLCIAVIGILMLSSLRFG